LVYIDLESEELKLLIFGTLKQFCYLLMKANNDPTKWLFKRWNQN